MRPQFAGPPPEFEPSAWKRTTHQYDVLVRHFFSKFFTTESLAADADATANIGPLLGLLSTPGAFLAMLLMPLQVTGWGLVNFRYFYLSWSMIVMALLVISRWEALFPDRADYQILTPLPIRSTTIFLARAIAFAGLVGVFLVLANLLGVLMWPGVELKAAPPRAIAAHALVTGAAGLFGALAAASIPALLLNLLPAAWFRRIAPVVQSLLTGALIVLLFLTPLLATLARNCAESHPEWLIRYPGYWFLGLYEQIGPVTRNTRLLDAGNYALTGLAGAFLAFLALWIPGYIRHSRKLLESPGTTNTTRGFFATRWNNWLNNNILTAPAERAVFHFIGATLARSTQHRLFLAAYGGFGAALTVTSLASGRENVAGVQFTLVFILVSALRAAFQIPAELRANWAFQLNENNSLPQYLSATRKWIIVCGLGPLFTALALFEFRFFNPGLAIWHLVFGTVASLLLVELMFLGFRKVPFTCPAYPGKFNLVGLVVLYLFGLNFYSRLLRTVQSLLDQSPIGVVIFLAATLIALEYLSRWRARDVESETGGVDFDGSEPQVRTLGIASY